MSGLKACKQIPKRQAGSALQETAAEAQPSQVESGDIRATRRAIETAADTVAAVEIAKEKVAEGTTAGGETATAADTAEGKTRGRHEEAEDQNTQEMSMDTDAAFGAVVVPRNNVCITHYFWRRRIGTLQR